MNAISYTPNLVGQGIEQLANEREKTLERVEQLAEEFEGVFLSLLTKELRSTIGEGGLFGGDSADSFGGLFDLFIGEHLASSEPLGIAKIFAEQYKQHLTDDQGSKQFSQSQLSVEA